MRLVRFFACAILLLLLTVPVLGTGHLDKIGTIPLGTMRNIIWNNTLYTQEGNTVRAYDISPGVNLGKIRANSYEGMVVFPNIVKGLYAKDNTLYVVTSNSFHTIDISNPLHPVFLGNVSRSMGANEVIVENGYAYIGGSGLMHIFDVSDLSAPTFLKSVSIPYGNLVRFASDGNYLYGGYQDSTSSISIWNISIPSSPTIVKNFAYNPDTDVAWTRGISYRNNTLYVTNYYRGLYAIDVTNRSNPVVLKASWRPADSGTGYISNTIFQNLLFVSVRYAGIEIYNISAPIPKKIGTQDWSLGYTEDISTNGNVAVVSRWTGGAMVFNTTSKTAPTWAGNINIPGEVKALAATTIGDMDILAAGGRNTGSWYYNITDPYGMNDVGYSIAAAFSPGNSRTYNIPWNGNYSYIEGDGNMGGAWIINMTNIESPGFANKNPPYKLFDPNDNVESINVDDKWIFVETQYAWFRIYNNFRKEKVTPPLVYENRSFFFEKNPDGHKIFQYTDGSDNLYVTNYQGKIMIFNMTIPTAPGKITAKSALNPHWLGRIAYNPTNKIVYGTYYNSGENQNYIYQVDVSDINNIHEETGKIKITDSQTRDIACNGTDVFIVGRVGANVRMYDFSIPTSPVLEDSGYTMDGDAEGITFFKGYLYTSFDGVITAWKVTPSSVQIPNLPQQTVGSQEQKPERQSTSSVVGNQNIITQVTGLWNNVVNFILHHFPFH